MFLLLRLVKWLPLNVVSFLGILQAIIKLAKEIITAILNIVFPVWPNHDAHFETKLLAVRAILEKVDAGIEKAKDFFLKKLGLSTP